MPDQIIKLSLLATWLEKIVAGYAQRGIEEIDLSGHDLYISIDTQVMFDLNVNPLEPVPIGSMADDLKELTKLVHNPDPFPTAVDIERLGNVLRAVSEVLSK